MSITGTGTQADPYIITTYAELVEKAAESGVYIKVGNDINITKEYPEGNMPTLTINSPIDGDNTKISNWYKITSGYCIDVKKMGIYGKPNLPTYCLIIKDVHNVKRAMEKRPFEYT